LKLLPTDLAAGYPCFVVSIGMIGVCTAVIGDVAGHLGCFIYLKDSVNAIAFVALGTSVPGKKKYFIDVKQIINRIIDHYRSHIISLCTLIIFSRFFV
jgi:hypothetical protein